MITEQQNQAAVPEVTARTDRSGGRLVRAALLGALLLLLGGLLMKDAASARLSAEMFSFPFQFDESEGMILAETQLLDHGVNIYLKPGPDLFIAAPYPPLYYLLTWPAQHLSGAGTTFKVGRALSMG